MLHGYSTSQIHLRRQGTITVCGQPMLSAHQVTSRPLSASCNACLTTVQHAPKQPVWVADAHPEPQMVLTSRSRRKGWIE